MTEIERAQKFVIDRVLDPALLHKDASKELKSALRHTKTWIKNFKKVGDLHYYLERFKKDKSDQKWVYRELTSLKLDTFENIKSEFYDIFSSSILNLTQLDDFIIGQQYTSYDINIFAKLYDNRTGGIIVIGDVGTHSAVFIKATLSGGKYPNEWLQKPQRLKYYLKSSKDRFNENSTTNRAIIGYPYIPIFAFVRNTEGENFILEGIYENVKLHREKTDDVNGNRPVWFELARRLPSETLYDRSIASVQNEFNAKVELSLKDSRSKRLERLKIARKLPLTKEVTLKIFVRNPDVVAEVLDRAQGRCEGCHDEAPFIRKSNSTGYLEVHHKTPLSLKGEDTVENAVALCPNCHREEHFGKEPRWLRSNVELPDYLE